MAELMLGQPLFPGESGIDQLVEIIKVLGTPTREQIRTMNPNYMEHRFPQIKPHPFNKVSHSIHSCFWGAWLSEYFLGFPEGPAWGHRPDFGSTGIHANTTAVCNWGNVPSVLRWTQGSQHKVARFATPQRRATGTARSVWLLSTWYVGYNLTYIIVRFTNGLVLELSIAPSLNNRLVPPHVRPALAARGLDLDNFKPLSKDQMMARLDWVWVRCFTKYTPVQSATICTCAREREQKKRKEKKKRIFIITQYEFLFYASGGFWIGKKIFFFSPNM